MVDLTQLHYDAAQAATPGERAAAWVRGFASRIQNECNNQDFAAIRELAVQAAQQADDMAVNVEHGWDDAERRREEAREATRRLAGTGAVAAVPATGVTRANAPHAGPTDHQRAPVPLSERDPDNTHDLDAAEEAVRVRGTAGVDGTVGSAGSVTSSGTVGSAGSTAGDRGATRRG